MYVIKQKVNVSACTIELWLHLPSPEWKYCNAEKQWSYWWPLLESSFLKKHNTKDP